MRLDGADIAQWDRDALGAHVGYLPQDVELFAGAVAENIARLGAVDSRKVVDAARLAEARGAVAAEGRVRLIPRCGGKVAGA